MEIYRQDKQTLLEDLRCTFEKLLRVNTIKWKYGHFPTFFIVIKLDVAVRIFRQHSRWANAGEKVYQTDERTCTFIDSTDFTARSFADLFFICFPPAGN